MFSSFRLSRAFFAFVLLALFAVACDLNSQEKRQPNSGRLEYAYEPKPEDEAFAGFNPAKATRSTELLLREGDRLAIVGDSITEQKMYSRMIENYLVACVPQFKVSVRQYGWSGEKTDGFLNRMDRDCLTFQPTIATICYGMNDSRYRPFDVTNGRWYRDHYSEIVRRFKSAGTRVVVGSPGCAGKLANWVKSKSGTLEEHNLHLCALRDIALEVAREEQVPFADIFWPMYQQQVLAPKRFQKSNEEYAVAGKDGIHPGWAGQVMMATAFLTAMGLDGNLGSIQVDWQSNQASCAGRHEIKSFRDGALTLISSQYPYCAQGALDDDNSIRSGMAISGFNERLNRFVLRIAGLEKRNVRLTWGEQSQVFSASDLDKGVNLAAEFPQNPFCEAFAKLDAAVLAKQTYETKQVKQHFHGPAARQDFKKVVDETEAERKPLAEAVVAAVLPVEHILKFELVD